MRILLIEDDVKVARFIKKGLEEEQYAVDLFHNGEDGAFWAMENEYDVIILDIMLPKKNGLEVCKEIRNLKIITPILMLTARDSLEDKVGGLDSGADDYLTKPFAFDELLARTRALFRRSEKYKSKSLKLRDLELDPDSRKVSRGEKEIILTGKEYAILEYFMRNAGKVLSETKIIEHVWDMNYESLTNIVNVYIHHLRNKIDKGFDKKLLYTVHGMGYVLKDEG